MKKILFILFSVTALVGCTLEEKIYSSSTPETYYQTVPQIQTGINGCYIPLRNIYANTTYIQVTDCASDIMYHGTDTRYDAQGNYIPAKARFGETMWSNCYIGIMRCNAMYAAIERAPLTDEEKLPLFAEVVIIRAFFYFILTNNFNGVPFYTEEVTDANNNRISTLPRTSASEIRKYCIDEIYDYIIVREALPMKRTYEVKDFRIGAAVGLMLAGKMCLWEKQWTKAIEIFGYLEGIYGNGAGVPDGCLDQYSVSDIKFRNRYTKESIFEIPGEHKDYGLTVSNSLASLVMPMRNSTVVEGSTDENWGNDDDESAVDLSVKTDLYAGVCIPELGTVARTVTPMRPTEYFFKTLMPLSNNKDKRRSTYENTKSQTEPVLIEDNGGYLAWGYSGWLKTENRKTEPRQFHFFSSISATKGTPYLGDKFWCEGMIYTYDSNNVKVFRFAHVVLALAEAHLRMSNFDKSLAYLNAVRTRAGLAALTEDAHGGDEVKLLDLILEEQGRELFGEFTRRHDLVRLGLWYERVQLYGGSELKKNTQFHPCREYYPIPDKQCVLSGGALTNDEYTKYGL